MLKKTGIPDPEGVYKNYPAFLSGGMRQRVMIAIAMVCNPALLIADEPTTALDVTIQAQILSLMKGLQKEYETAIMFITHDLGVIAETADRVMVMYAGQVVEEADVRSIFHNPVHPYTRGLLNSTVRVHEIADRLETIDGVVPTLSKMPKGCRFAPRCPYACDTCRATIPQLRSVGDCPGHYARCIRAGGEPSMSDYLLEVENLKVHFPVGRGFHKNKKILKAVDGVSFRLKEGETLGIVGESGCGKSTCGNSIIRLLTPTEGRILFEGKDPGSDESEGAARIAARYSNDLPRSIFFAEPAYAREEHHCGTVVVHKICPKENWNAMYGS